VKLPAESSAHHRSCLVDAPVFGHDRLSADLTEVASGRFGAAHRPRTAATTSRRVACSTLSFFAARFCLMVLLGFYDGPSWRLVC
jgi:hypothetical protein